ncbi:MAG: ATP-dependent sacrificial sulfur transferase LarE [Deltaproteobacteria bacterium]|nr:ATP-dependent sacrificial sulfur transferase LarE [Deltaproteobacteria bacterium]
MNALDAKHEDLRRSLDELGRVLVCFSGGVDSSFLVRVARDVLGDRVVALTTVSPTNPEEDTAEAIALARELGLDHAVVRHNELDIPNYRENPANRCYFCKSTLYEIAAEQAKRRAIPWIVDGINLDDLGDYRPGLQAAAERAIRHPLAAARLTKREIREISRRLGLRTFDRPASPCLSSRFPYGTAITIEGLERVARAERWLRARGFRECRVRYFGERARIEVPPADIARLNAEPLRGELAAALGTIGFAEVEVDPRGFRSGRLNEALRVTSSSY